VLKIQAVTITILAKVSFLKDPLELLIRTTMNLVEKLYLEWNEEREKDTTW
jgi:hypothetical protein